MCVRDAVMCVPLSEADSVGLEIGCVSATQSEVDSVGLEFGCMSATLSEADRVGLEFV